MKLIKMLYVGIRLAVCMFGVKMNGVYMVVNRLPGFFVAFR